MNTLIIPYINMFLQNKNYLLCYFYIYYCIRISNRISKTAIAYQFKFKFRVFYIFKLLNLNYKKDFLNLFAYQNRKIIKLFFCHI